MARPIFTKFGGYDAGSVLRPYLEGNHDWAIGGAINREILNDMEVDRICTKFGEHDMRSLPNPVVKFSNVWPIGGTAWGGNLYLLNG